ncbi:MAG: hypothetical protein JWN34_902 [Bryobacterales bacterium]|nr:hypothetical protein [Bryobacterales bacterium]
MVVDVSHASLHTQRKPHTARFVPSENGTGKAVLSVVCHSQCLGLSVDFDNGSDRAEHFVLSDLHIVLYVDEYVRRQHVTGWITTDHLPCPRGSRSLDMRHMRRKLFLIDDWTDGRAGIVGIAGLQILSEGTEVTDEFVINLRIDNDAVGAPADLALMQESASNRGAHRMLRITARFQRGSLMAGPVIATFFCWIFCSSFSMRCWS